VVAAALRSPDRFMLVLVPAQGSRLTPGVVNTNQPGTTSRRLPQHLFPE
jgi:hypothetical protein